MTTFNCDSHSFPMQFESNSPTSPLFLENAVSHIALKALERPARRIPLLAIKLPSQPVATPVAPEAPLNEVKKRPRVAPVELNTERPKKKERLTPSPVQLPKVIHQSKDDQNPYSSHTLPSGQIYLKLKTEEGTVNLNGATKVKKNAIKVGSNGEPNRHVARLVSHNVAAFAKIENEYNLLSQFKGVRGIVQVHDLVNEPNKRGEQTMTVYEENCNQGDVLTYLSQNENVLPPKTFPAVAEDWIYGLKSIHEKGIAHRDIKPDNLLLHSGPNGLEGKICDFDLAIPIDSGKTTIAGTGNFSSPEKTLAESTSNAIWECHKELKSDVWSLGITLYLLYSGKSVAWYELDETQRALMLESYADQEDSGSFSPEPDSVADPVLHLIWMMCQCNPDRRLNMHEVKTRWDAIPVEKRDLRLYS